MSYTRSTWVKGDIVSSARLNNIEEGIANLSTHVDGLTSSDTGASSAAYVSSVTQTSGSINVVHSNFNPVVNIVAGTTNAAPQVQITVAGNSSAAKSITTATTSAYGVTKLSNSINSSDETYAATPKAVKDALDAATTNTSSSITALNGGTIESPGAGKTLSALSETAGQISASFQNIAITSSQISDGNAANQVLKLNSSGIVDEQYLPSYVDDVLEGTLATFPTPGETGKIYVDTATNTSYRWSGTQYTKVASDLSLGTTSSTAYRGDYGARAYEHAGASAQYTAAASGLYRVTVNAEGHVTATDSVQASDITGLLGTAAVKDVPTSGNATTTQVVMGSDSRLSDARNAADVYAWAKESTKPTYTATEVGVPAWAQANTKPTYTASEVGVPAWAQESTKPTYTASEVGVPTWAQASTKPTYTASEVGALPDTTVIPDITGLAENTDPTFTIDNEITFTDGTDTVTFTLAELTALKGLITTNP